MFKLLIKLVLFVGLVLFLSQFEIGNQPIGALVYEKTTKLWNIVSDSETPRKLVSAIGDIELVPKRKQPEKAADSKSTNEEESISDEDRQSLMQLLQ
ncbi:MAG: hypothetical protein H6617_08215 [Bdellovibrionaceae bacterium]|nr:hypothetical protein [Bdellovibrionales bacterium]MCB9254650.1 hypothetical protein [Pseudobdellovibrionaceae bacterium]